MIARKNRLTACKATLLMVFAALLIVAVLPAAVHAQQIDDENERGLVIDDMWYPFADNVEFYANPEKTILANRGDFSTGTEIGYELNADGKISAVWLR